MGPLHIGTSGWSYDHWRGPFYPEDLPKSEWLRFYAEHFTSVEINNSFYQLPSADTLAHWRETVPPGFTFAFKANRYITHMKKLKDPEQPLNTLYERTEVLGAKLGPILFQLPPSWRFDGERLSHFLDALSSDHRHAFEFRDERWITPEALDLLHEHEQAFCIYDFGGRLSPKEVTTDFVYVRLHGPLDEPYRGSYNVVTLAGWAGAFSSWRRQDRDVYCYFDNDESGCATKDASIVQTMFA